MKSFSDNVVTPEEVEQIYNDLEKVKADVATLQDLDFTITVSLLSIRTHIMWLWIATTIVAGMVGGVIGYLSR